jgi:hypothetical protein
VMRDRSPDDAAETDDDNLRLVRKFCHGNRTLVSI